MPLCSQNALISVKCVSPDLLKSQKTNLCQAIRSTQVRGLSLMMPRAGASSVVFGKLAKMFVDGLTKETHH